MSGLRAWDGRTVPSSKRLAAMLGLAVLGFSFWAGAVQAEPLKCRRAIAKASSKYLETLTVVLHKCEEAVLKGKTTGPCPDGKAQTRLARAESKLAAAIGRRCGGSDHVCGVGSGDDPLGSIEWDFGPCPDFMGGGCTGAIAHCGDVTTCLSCASEHGADELRGLYYDDLIQGNTDKTLARCRQAIGKNATKFARSKARIMAGCRDGLLRGSITGPCPNGRAAERIAKAENKMASQICRACGGANRNCGDADDLDVALIGAGANCPNVTVPNGPACGGPITDVRTLLRCVDCMSQFTTECLDRLAVPGLAVYPDECKAAADGSTPTPTATPAATATATVTSTEATATSTAATATPTVTPTPTGATPTATPTADPGLCNNGVLDLGETCDFPDVGCGAGEVCAGCLTCLPVPGTCLDGTLDLGEVCEVPGEGCAEDELCANCLTCLPAPGTCGNATVDAGEACDGNATCGAGEVCLGCIGCLPQPNTCLNGALDSGEACETSDNEGCSEDEVCIGCLGCLPLPAGCGNGAIALPETCELDGDGCEAGELCVGCAVCVPNVTTCGNQTIDPGETCELPNQGCGALQVCLLCQTCLGL
jgi:hypothetical protein